MKRPSPIADAYASYAELVLPTDAKAVQRRETQRAFFAGALSVFAAVVAEDAKISTFETIDAELRAFLAAVRAGRC